MTDHPTCATCRFGEWIEVNGGYRKCRQLPPGIGQPVVEADDWCGEHTEMKTCPFSNQPCRCPLDRGAISCPIDNLEPIQP